MCFFRAGLLEGGQIIGWLKIELINLQAENENLPVTLKKDWLVGDGWRWLVGWLVGDCCFEELIFFQMISCETQMIFNRL